MEPIIHETAHTEEVMLMLEQSQIPKTIIDETALTDAIQAMGVIGWKVGGT